MATASNLTLRPANSEGRLPSARSVSVVPAISLRLPGMSHRREATVSAEGSYKANRFLVWEVT